MQRYVISPDVLTIIEHCLKMVTDPCLADVLDYLIRIGQLIREHGNGLMGDRRVICVNHLGSS